MLTHGCTCWEVVVVNPSPLATVQPIVLWIFKRGIFSTFICGNQKSISALGGTEKVNFSKTNISFRTIFLLFNLRNIFLKKIVLGIAGNNGILKGGRFHILVVIA